MRRKLSETYSEISELKKKIDNYTNYQWLVFIPVWVLGIWRLVNPTPTVPGREIYVLLFNVGSIIFSVVAFVAIRLQIRQLKAKVAQLDDPDHETKRPFDPPLHGA